jgi:hypothetical protein
MITVQGQSYQTCFFRAHSGIVVVALHRMVMGVAVDLFSEYLLRELRTDLVEFLKLFASDGVAQHASSDALRYLTEDVWNCAVHLFTQNEKVPDDEMQSVVWHDCQHRAEVDALVERESQLVSGGRYSVCSALSGERSPGGVASPYRGRASTLERMSAWTEPGDSDEEVLAAFDLDEGGDFAHEPNESGGPRDGRETRGLGSLLEAEADSSKPTNPGGTMSDGPVSF